MRRLPQILVQKILLPMQQRAERWKWTSWVLEDRNDSEQIPENSRSNPLLDLSISAFLLFASIYLRSPRIPVYTLNQHSNRAEYLEHESEDRRERVNNRTSRVGNKRPQWKRDEDQSVSGLESDALLEIAILYLWSGWHSRITGVQHNISEWRRRTTGRRRRGDEKMGG